MKKAKFFASAVAAVCIFSAVSGGGSVSASAGTECLDDFGDNFESYEVAGKYIENDAAFAAKWTNNVLSGGEEQLVDSHLKGIAKIGYENGSDGNKVLCLNNASVEMNSYFHIGPAGDYRIKNFTAGFRVKFLADPDVERGWVGVSFRKKAESHYMGTNNLLFTVQRYTASTAVSPHCYANFNGGSLNNFGDDSIKQMFGDKLSYTSSVYQVDGSAVNEDMPWIDYKLSVENNNYKMYLNGVLTADCTFGVAAFDYFGYMSLNCCTAKVLIDDFYVNVADGVFPPAINPLASPVISFDPSDKTVKWDKIDGANLYAVCVNGKVVKSSAKNSYALGGSLAPGDYKIKVKAVSEDTFENLDSKYSNEIVYTMPSEENSEKGCKSECGVSEVIFLLSIAGIIFFSKK